jgi:superfamily II DNA/RNA helicase
LRISSDILKGLKDVKIESPSPLQKKTIKMMKEGGDLLVNVSREDQPETGYLIPILDQIAKQDRRQGTKAIILTNSSERAAELEKWIWGVGYHSGIESAPIENSGDKGEQKSSIYAGPTIIVANPERLSELMEENRIIFRETHYLILDNAEAIQSWDSVNIISKRIIGKCQRIATVRNTDEQLVKQLDNFLTDPETLGFEAPKKEATAQANNGSVITKDLTQYYINVPPRMKISTLMAHLENSPGDSVLIFTASRRTADRLYRVFRKSGKRAVSVHDKLDEKTFQERFDRFTSSNVNHLIAGEMSAANLDIENVMQVINYDVPEEVQEYKLRAELIGDGKATRITSLVSKQDRKDIKEIIEELGYAPEEIPLPESIEERKKNKRGSGKKGKKRGAGKKQSRHKKKKPRPKPKDEPAMGLPRPSYDKLSGGRTGKKDKKEEKGVVGFFKKLFS